MLPGQDKRERDLTKKLDKLAAQAGWYTFVSAQAHAIATGKAGPRPEAARRGGALVAIGPRGPPDSQTTVRPSGVYLGPALDRRECGAIR